MNKPQLAELSCVKLKSKGNTCCVSKMSELYQTDRLIRKQHCQSEIHFYGSAACEECLGSDLWTSDSVGSFSIRRTFQTQSWHKEKKENRHC